MSDQSAVWNGVGGNGWVAMQAVTDRLFAPVQQALVDAVVAAGPATDVLDVGCGTGGTTVALAEALAPDGRCTGLDVSASMLAAARARAEAAGVPVDFVEGDAQRHPFAPGAFDAVTSRFGVMFFDDPTAAFANLRRTTRPAGALRCVTWRDAADNPFMTEAERAAAPVIDLPRREPDGPGQFGLADGGRCRRLLVDAGWSDVELAALDVECAMGEAELVPYLTNLGPISKVWGDLDEPTRARVLDAVLPAFDRYVVDAEVRFTAACWMVSATA